MQTSLKHTEACNNASLPLPPPRRLAEVLKADTEKKIKAVCVVHNETTTGVTSDIPEVGGLGGGRWSEWVNVVGRSELGSTAVQAC